MSSAGTIIAILILTGLLLGVGAAIVVEAFNATSDEEVHGDIPQVHEEMRAATKNLAGSGLRQQRPSVDSHIAHDGNVTKP